MSRLGKIARRSFLFGSAALMGGVAFGAYKLKTDPANPLIATLKEGEVSFNPWVLITPEKITLIAPHTDLGQGARQMQTLLMAEELDLEMDQFETSAGMPSAAYYNTAVDDLAPVMLRDESFGAEFQRGAMGAIFKLMGIQMTGGSTSTPDSFDKLRFAAASARETLKLTASEQARVPFSQLRTAGGAVILPNGDTIAYTDLAAQAAEREPIKDVTLRPPSDWRLIGKPLIRNDILDKSTGQQIYGIDLELPDMLHASIRMNPAKGGALLSMEADKAQTLRGVVDVVQLSGGYGVIAQNTWAALRALDHVDVTWGPAPYPADQEAHWQQVEASFTAERLDKVWRDDGAQPSGEAQLTASYRAPYVAHQPLEPLSAVIQVGKSRVDIWVAHQLPRFAVDKVAKITGHKPADVHLHNQIAGGSFGHRLEFFHLEQAAHLALKTAGRPLKLTLSREEDFAQDFTRQIGAARGTAHVSGGQVKSLTLDIATVSPARSQSKRLGQPMPGPDMQIVAGAWNAPYDLEGFRVRGYAVPELAPTSSWRSVGASTAGFFMETLLDEAIHAAGADPMAERLRLCSDPLSRQVLEEVARMSQWGASLPAGTGRGIALVHSFGVPCAQVVEVIQEAQGLRISKVWVAAEVGTIVDPVNFENQVAGGVIWGLGHAMNCEITYRNGAAEQMNFDSHDGMRISQCPEIIVKGLENGADVRGIGEPPVPPAAPALGNAIFAATGTRLRQMPFWHSVDFA